MYREGASLFIDGEVMKSAEGTTQGDPMAMAMYAIGITPLIQRLGHINSTKQVWYVDDSTASSSLQDLLQWWLNLNESGHLFGYNPNAFKSVLLAKPEHINNVKLLFHNHNLSIVSDGACVSGAPVGSSEFFTSWVMNKVQSCVKEISLLSTIALSQPQSAFSALTHGVMSCWTYSLEPAPILTLYHSHWKTFCIPAFLPALTSQDAPDDCLRDLFGLPCRAGGLGIPNPCVMSKNQFSNSLLVTAPLVELFINHRDSVPIEVFVAREHIKRSVHAANHRAVYHRSTVIPANLIHPLQKLFDITNEKGSSIMAFCYSSQITWLPSS